MVSRNQLLPYLLSRHQLLPYLIRPCWSGKNGKHTRPYNIAQNSGRACSSPSFRFAIKVFSSSSSAKPVTRSSGCDSAATANADAAADVIAAAVKQQQPRPIFPWRHEPAENPIPRLTAGTVEYESQIILSPRQQSLFAWAFLGMPFWQRYFNQKHWRKDLANTCGWAFAQGVSGILSNVYSVSDENLLNSDGRIDFVYPRGKDDNREGKNESVTEAHGDNNNIGNDNKIKGKSNHNLDMFSRPLRNLFQSAHKHGKDHLQIRLQSEPLQGEICSIFCFPFVTRSSIESRPEELNRVRRQVTLMRKNPIETFQEFFEYHEKELEKNDQLETAVEIQVMIICNEIFQVIDKETGFVLQGSKDGAMRTVLHVVRLETTVSSKLNDTFPFFPYSTYGNWQIVDIDDLALGPTPWYNSFL